MLTCHYSDILRIAARLAGLDANDLQDSDEAVLRVSIDRQMHDIQTLAQWPELNPCEERQFRADYSAVVTYAAPTATTFNEVFDEPTQLYFQNLRSALAQAPTIAGVENSAYWAVCKTEYSGEDWATGTAYVATAGAASIVRNPDNNRFYQCHTAHTAGASFDATKFGILTPFDAYIDLDQTGETPIGVVRGVWNANPRIFTRARRVTWGLSDNGIEVVSTAAKVWVEFSIRLARLWGDVLDLTATYAADEQVQFTPATNAAEATDFYTVLTTTSAGETPDTDPDKFQVVELPDFLRAYLGAKAAMDLLAGDSDGLFQKADQEADRSLTTLLDNLYRVQQQVPRGNTQVLNNA
jgi:hypothetical protein